MPSSPYFANYYPSESFRNIRLIGFGEFYWTFILSLLSFRPTIVTSPYVFQRYFKILLYVDLHTS